MAVGSGPYPTNYASQRCLEPAGEPDGALQGLVGQAPPRCGVTPVSGGRTLIKPYKIRREERRDTNRGKTSARTVSWVGEKLRLFAGALPCLQRSLSPAAAFVIKEKQDSEGIL